MNYKPSSTIMDLIMPDSRNKGIPPQKLIDHIIYEHYKRVSKEESNDKRAVRK